MIEQNRTVENTILLLFVKTKLRYKNYLFQYTKCDKI